MSLGEDWYREFWDRFPVYVSIHQVQWDGTTSDKKSSRFMFDFLTYLAQELGFQEEAEEPAFRARRFDRVWRREGDTVVLEHENWGIKAVLGDEIRKLARRTGDLHICMTYLPAAEFPGHPYVEECKRILSEERYESEFLLVLGTNNMSEPTDWVCHRIFPETSLKAEMLALPHSAPSGRTSRTRRRDRGAQRRSGWQALKRTYPSSHAVVRALRQAAKRRFTANYIRTLESLKRYWERREK